MAYTWKKGGYENAVDYDQNAGVVKYGDYEFHYKDVGLDTYKMTIDPAQIKTSDDVYNAFGIKKQVFDPASKLYGTSNIGVGRTRPLNSLEAWKYEAANNIWLKLDRERNPDKYSTLNNSFKIPYGRTSPESTQGLPKTENRLYGSGNIGAGLNYAPKAALPLKSITMLDNGMYEVAYADAVPGTYDFVNRLSSMANALSASISGGDGSSQRPRRRTATGAF